jgi:hypothetical protein
LTLDQFAHEGGGVHLYASELRSQRQNEPGLDGQAVVEDIDYSLWFRYLPDDKGWSRVHVIFFRGNITAQVVVWKLGPPDPSLAMTLSRLQYDKLPALGE